jgi:hypothetical protein
VSLDAGGQVAAAAVPQESSRELHALSPPRGPLARPALGPNPRTPPPTAPRYGLSEAQLAEVEEQLAAAAAAAGRGAGPSTSGGGGGGSSGGGGGGAEPSWLPADFDIMGEGAD